MIQKTLVDSRNSSTKITKGTEEERKTEQAGQVPNGYTGAWVPPIMAGQWESDGGQWVRGMNLPIILFIQLEEATDIISHTYNAVAT